MLYKVQTLQTTSHYIHSYTDGGKLRCCHICLGAPCPRAQWLRLMEGGFDSATHHLQAKLHKTPLPYVYCHLSKTASLCHKDMSLFATLDKQNQSTSILHTV